MWFLVLVVFCWFFGLLWLVDEVVVLMWCYMYDFGVIWDYLVNVVLVVCKMVNCNFWVIMYECEMICE